MSGLASWNEISRSQRGVIPLARIGNSSQEEMEMQIFDRFQVILPTLYYRRGSHAWSGSDDDLLPWARLDDIMVVSCATDSLTDWHYHWYDGTSWCRTPLYRECEYKGDFWDDCFFRRCRSCVHWERQWQVNFPVMEMA